MIAEQGRGTRSAGGCAGGTSGSTCPGRSIMKLAAEMEIHIAVNFMIDGAEGGQRAGGREGESGGAEDA